MKWSRGIRDENNGFCDGKKGKAWSRHMHCPHSLLGMNIQYVKAVEGPADHVSVAAEIIHRPYTL